MFCTTKQRFDSSTGYEYFQHAIGCRPLYQCQKCKATIKNFRFYDKHIRNCNGIRRFGRPGMKVKQESCPVKERTCDATLKETVDNDVGARKLTSFPYPIVLLTDIRKSVC